MSYTSPASGSVPAFFDPSEPFGGWGEDATELRILDAARRCLLQYGPEKMTLRDVAGVAGISRGWIYNYFSNREELVAAVARWSTEAFLTEIGACLDSGLGLDAQIAGLVVELRRWQSAARRLRWSAPPAGDDEPYLLTGAPGPFLQTLAETVVVPLRAAQRRGEIRSSPSQARAAEWVVRQVHSLAVIPTLSFDSTDQAALEGFIRQFVIGGMLTGGLQGRSSVRGWKPPLENHRRFLSEAPMLTESSAETVDRVLDAARRCVVAHGLTDFRMEDVARMAGLSRTSVYACFPNRSKLMAELLSWGSRVFGNDLTAAMDAHRAFEDQIVAAALTLLLWRREVERLGAFTPMQFLTAMTEGDPATIFRPLLELFARYVKAAQLAGEVDRSMDPLPAGELIVRSLMSFEQVLQLGFDTEDPDAVADFVRQFVLRGLTR